MFPVLVELVLELTSASVLCKITIVVASNLREPLTVYSEKPVDRSLPKSRARRLV